MDLQPRFAALTELLLAHRPLWQLATFGQHHVPWRSRYPQLASWLEQLDDRAVERLEGDAEALLHAVAPFLPDLPPLAELCRLAASEPSASLAPAWLGRGVGGRKWTQVTAFAAALPAVDAPLLEWCAGKGHLGRLLAWQRGTSVVSLEWQAALCDEGEKLARQHAVSQHFQCVDVLTAQASPYLHHDVQAVALHACGALHRQLIRQGSAASVPFIHIAPCCYHLLAEASYRGWGPWWPAQLVLDVRDRHLAVEDSVTGGNRVDRLRHQERLYRLAFDRWQRQVRGEDCYLPVASMPKSQLGQGLGAFCRWAAGSKGLPEPVAVDEAGLLAQATQDLRLANRLDLVRHLFRRPLELVLVLDMALYLQSKGYEVRLETFTERAVTPRNLLLSARLQRPTRTAL